MIIIAIVAIVCFIAGVFINFNIASNAMKWELLTQEMLFSQAETLKNIQDLSKKIKKED